MNFPDPILEQLRCSLCRAYLSCAPLQLLPDGNSLCGRCLPLTVTGPTYRILSLEAVLNHVEFPCKYKKFGCEQHLAFGQVDEHEFACDFRGFPCPQLECLWEGTILQLPQHLTTDHRDLTNPRAEFELDIRETKQGIMMIAINRINFIVKYKYSAETGYLYYDIRYFTPVEAFCEIRLMNGMDHDYRVTAKGSSCRPFDYNFYDAQNANILDLNNILPALNHLNTIVLAIDLTIGNLGYSDLLRCATCEEFLSLPIFECARGIICSDCSRKFNDSQPSSNEDIKQRIMDAMLPCRWKCEFTHKGDQVKKHEKNCMYRIYCCPVSKCDNTFILITRASHMEAHEYKHFTDSYDYTVRFSETGAKNYVYTIINEEIIGVKIETYLCFNTNTSKEYSVHRLTLHGTDISYVKATVAFRHFHCARSCEFAINKQARISLDMLPVCFKREDELVATIRTSLVVQNGE